MASYAPHSFFSRVSNGVYTGADARGLNGPKPPTIAIDPEGTFRRSVPQNARLYNPDAAPQATRGDQQADPNEASVIQTEYLTSVIAKQKEQIMTSKELQEKENLRKKLERVLHSMLAEYAVDNVLPFDPKDVKLKTYGSLASGFAVKGSDIDLLLYFPQDKGPIGPIEQLSRRMFEKRLLDMGFGARLLTETRVPIMQVCQDPPEDLLFRLRRYRQEWDDEEAAKALEPRPEHASNGNLELPDGKAIDNSTPFAELDVNPAEIPLPPSPLRSRASLEFSGHSVGTRCDINFSNYVAIYNTALLRSYCKCDRRVRDMGLLVKTWAKARKINTPYHGTLSSYGYLMMVLHYLMNVAYPPVIPNLQVEGQRRRSKTVPPKPAKLCEGHDVTFMDDEREIQRLSSMGQLTKNREVLGSLLKGFFRYFSDQRGFNWVRNIISIRTPGGVLQKASKGWTEAKWTGAKGTVRQRYLLAIEDPFELDHNIARTVGHSGIVAIRNEFRRASHILNNVQYIPGIGWQWRQEDGSVGDDLFADAPDRGDLHRKDEDFHRQRIKKEKQKQEADGKSGSDFDRSDSSLTSSMQRMQDESTDKSRFNKSKNPKDRSVDVIIVNKDADENADSKASQEDSRICYSVTGATGQAVMVRNYVPAHVNVNDKSPTIASNEDPTRASSIIASLHSARGTFDPSKYGKPIVKKQRVVDPVCVRSCTSSTLAMPARDLYLALTHRPLRPLTPPGEDSIWRSTQTRFDPAQLHDMAVISRGGNGCVRAGEDFESSWGGAGRMGTPTKKKYYREAGREDGAGDVEQEWTDLFEDMQQSRTQGTVIEIDVAGLPASDWKDVEHSEENLLCELPVDIADNGE
ncbi:MAG: hypothetical protein Q9227_005487 [Pyrenula ochraceoflavens]